MSAIHASNLRIDSEICESRKSISAHSSEVDVHVVCDELRLLSNQVQAEKSRTFFKTDNGGYAEHDVFIGVSAPMIKKLASAHEDIDLKSLRVLLISCINEERLLALIIMRMKFEKMMHKEIYDLYMNCIDCVNNWNLVDSSAHYIVGPYLQGKDKSILFELAQSAHWWRRRIAIVSTFAYIKQDDFDVTLVLAKMLLADKHGLINKAVGWMLREVGKRNKKVLISFLNSNKDAMSRVTLRYAIELFKGEERNLYLKSKV